VATKDRVEITNTAQNDPEEIWTRIAAYYIDDANRFVAHLEERIKTLERMPHRCATIPENELLGSDYRHLIIDDYRVIFRVAERSVWILRIIHGNRLLDTSFFG
jgi:toxin ParE1/3/4